MALDALGVVAVSVVGIRLLVGRWVGSGDKEKDRESEMFGDVGLVVERGVVKEVKEVKQ
jgi:membrane protein implicated in regulation of membrane protease activity